MVTARLEIYSEFMDKKVVITMYDGQLCVGIFRSFDQYNNITLENSYIGDEKMDKLYVVRGENIISIGFYKDPE